MITSITPCFEFSDCIGYLVDGASGVREGSIGKVYVASLMSEIKRETRSSTQIEAIYSPNQIFINDGEKPKSSNYVTKTNYIEARFESEPIMDKANQELYEEYIQSENPSPIYYIPFSASFSAGTEVYVSSMNEDITSLSILSIE